MNGNLGKIPPQAVDLEEAVIGSCLNDRKAIEIATEYLDTVCFYKETNGKIFSAIKDLAKKGNPVDILTVANKMKETTAFDEIGGIPELMRLSEISSNWVHTEFHCQIVKQRWISREVIRLTSETQNMAFDDASDISDTIDLLERNVEQLKNAFIGADEGKPTKQVAKVTMKEIEEDAVKVTQNKINGINTGIFSLNLATGGWRSPNFIVLAARPSTGKTSLMLHFIIAAAKAGHPVNVYGFEMEASDLFRIVLSGEADIRRTRVRDGNLTPDEWKQLNEAVGRLEDLPIIWYDSAEIKANRIKANTKRNRKAGRCEMVFVDNLQIVPPEDEKAARETQISKISRTLKSITLSEKIPVMALAQLNRDVDKRTKGSKPVLADLRESGAIEQDADIVIFPFRDENGNFVLNIAKHRRGKTGDIPIIANEEMTRFSDPVPEEYQTEADYSSRYEKDKEPF